MIIFILRKVPKPVESWPTVIDAFEHGKICPSPGKMVPQPFEQSEDCLTLNIFVPGNEFYIHPLKLLF